MQQNISVAPIFGAARRWFTGIALLAASVGAVGAAAIPQSASAAAKPVAMMSCAQIDVVRPTSFVISCADGNSYLQKIKWSTWTATSAKATATFTENNCTPYCAAGKFINYPAKVTLSVVKSTARGKLFTKLYVSYLSNKKPQSFSFALLT
jgi:hypothetical protein